MARQGDWHRSSGVPSRPTPTEPPHQSTLQFRRRHEGQVSVPAAPPVGRCSRFGCKVQSDRHGWPVAVGQISLPARSRPLHRGMGLARTLARLDCISHEPNGPALDGVRAAAARTVRANAIAVARARMSVSVICRWSRRILCSHRGRRDDVGGIRIISWKVVEITRRTLHLDLARGLRPMRILPG